MTVSEIPANELVQMTPELYQEFCQGGCVPACHFTNDWICLGDWFRLATVDKWDGKWADEVMYIKTVDVMLSAGITVKQFNDREIEAHRVKSQQYKIDSVNRRGGCFRIDGKIVI